MGHEFKILEAELATKAAAEAAGETGDNTGDSGAADDDSGKQYKHASHYRAKGRKELCVVVVAYLSPFM